MWKSRTKALRSEVGSNGDQSRAKEIISSRFTDGSLALIAGVTVIVRTIIKEQSRTRTALFGLVGSGLLLIGVRQRQSLKEKQTPDSPEQLTHQEDKARESPGEIEPGEVNPRGTTAEPDIETETEPDEGRVQFTDEQPNGPHSGPDIDETEQDDPRITDDDSVEIDLSEASMADEASEAVGPSPQQAEPTQTDDTEPEHSPEEETDQKIEDAGEAVDDTEDSDQLEDKSEGYLDSADEVDENGNTDKKENEEI